jgi:hypothetical protein
MNIFYLDDSPYVSATAMTDKHVVKMIVESAQLLSTAHHILDGASAIPNIYRKTHSNHPSAIWVRESVHNYQWLVNHLQALLTEYAVRYNKQPTDHATHKVYMNLRALPKNIPNTNATPIKCAITNTAHIIQGNPIQSYRNYYLSEKLKTEKDKNRYLTIIK